MALEDNEKPNLHPNQYPQNEKDFRSNLVWRHNGSLEKFYVTPTITMTIAITLALTITLTRKSKDRLGRGNNFVCSNFYL